MLIPLIGAAEMNVKLVEYQTKSGKKLQALFALPANERKQAAAIYLHGYIVEKIGYEKAAEAGYDVKAFVEAMARDGFAAIAPLRGIDEPFAEEELAATLDFLSNNAEVQTDRIALIGFSKGGRIAAAAAARSSAIKALVLMSPALGQALDRLEIEKLNIPVFLSLGIDDPAGIKEMCTDKLLPLLKKSGVELEFRSNYPGNHKWFWKPRKEYWPDITAFLYRHLG